MLPTISGPMTKEVASPRYGNVDDMAVAVVRSFVGNQVADIDVTAAIMTGPASPMKMCPIFMVLYDMGKNRELYILQINLHNRH